MRVPATMSAVFAFGVDATPVVQTGRRRGRQTAGVRRGPVRSQHPAALVSVRSEQV